MRRLFSTFAGGWPGAGLLLLRLAAGGTVIANAFMSLRSELPMGSLLPHVLAIAAAILLLAGLWTPVVGSLVAVYGLWKALSHPGDPSSSILLGTIGAALALLGPGLWSADARLFGWRRIDLRDRAS